MTATAAIAEVKGEKKPYIPLERGWWRIPLLYMLSLSMVGLELYPAIGISLIMLANQWRHDRYNFLIMLTMLTGSYGMMKPEQFPIWTSDIMLLVSAVLWFMYRKPTILKRALCAVLLYILFMLVIALMSVESMTIQVFMMRNYWHVLYIIVPIAIFAGKDFKFDTFIVKTFPFMLMMAIFYVLDAYIINGHIFLPKDTGWNGSTFYSPAIHLFSFSPYRVYPSGLFLYALIFLPLLRRYRMHWYEWALFLLSLAASMTFTVIFSFIAVYIIFQGKPKAILKWFSGAIVLFVGLYFIDGALPKPADKGSEDLQTQLRIKSTIDQFFALFEAVDDEDLAEFGSGRMAQVIPKLEIVSRENRQLIGLGFLHPAKTTLNQYIITNDYYSDVEAAEEVSAVVEVGQVQVYISMGWLGIIAVTAFLLYLYFIIRRLPNSYLYLSMIVFIFIWSLGGFSGVNFSEGGQLISLAFAVVILQSREQLGFRLQRVAERRDGRQSAR